MSRNSLAQALAIHAWLEADQNTPHGQRVSRDRAVGQQLQTQDSKSSVLHWWQVVAASQDESQDLQIERARRIISVVLVVLGLFVGASMCTAALAYDGRYPVNLLAFLGVMLGIPLCFFILALLSSGLRQLGVDKLSVFIASLRLNRWLMGVWDKLGDASLGRNFARSNASGRLAYWQLHVFSQQFALGFYIGALIVFIVLVAVTDLAFGWSTTLNLSAETVFVWADVLASPWAELWPAAAPDVFLVEVSQYFRLETDLALGDVGRLGDWWPFVLMCLSVWGLLPRLVWLGLAVWQVRRATSQFLLEHSEVTALLDRLSTPLLEPAQATTDVDQLPELENRERAASSAGTGLRRQTDAVLMWNGAMDTDQAEALFGAVLSFNSWDSIADQQQILANIPTDATRLLVLVKGWEPPVLEFGDFLLALCERFSHLVSIVVVPLGVTALNPSAADVQVWSRAMAKLNEPRVYVTTMEEQ